MSKLMLSNRLHIILAVAAAASTTGLFGMASLNAAPTISGDRSTVVAYNNMCGEDELSAGEDITVGGDDYTLAEDENGLFIEYVMVDSETGEQTSDEVGTYSVTEFASDCETVTLQQIDGVDSLVGDDVDSEEEASADEDMEEGEEG
jgi:hypothetical protein